MKKLGNIDSALLAIPVLLLIAGLSFGERFPQVTQYFRLFSLLFCIGLSIRNMVITGNKSWLSQTVFFHEFIQFTFLTLVIIQFPGAKEMGDLGKVTLVFPMTWFLIKFLQKGYYRFSLFLGISSLLYFLMMVDGIWGVLPVDVRLLVYPLLASLITIQVNQQYETTTDQRVLVLLTLDAVLIVIASLFRLL